MHQVCACVYVCSCHSAGAGSSLPPMWIPANEFMTSGFTVSGGFMSHGAILLDYLAFVIFGGLPGAHTISVLERRLMVGFWAV